MATFDFAPMFRTTIGYDELPDLLSQSLERETNGYPPYNVEKVGTDEFRIVMAVAGFSREDIELVQAENRLTIKGRTKDADSKMYLYRGIASRAFTREFDLANHVEVTRAELVDGLLIVSLKRELPEAMKPRTIPIKSDEGVAPISRFAKQAA